MAELVDADVGVGRIVNLTYLQKCPFNPTCRFESCFCALPVIMEDKMKKICENCKYYRMLDSGYGYCNRYPPKYIIIKLIPIRYKIQYPEITWDNMICGEFKIK
jgi:hypothetical protein